MEKYENATVTEQFNMPTLGNENDFTEVHASEEYGKKIVSRNGLVQNTIARVDNFGENSVEL